MPTQANAYLVLTDGTTTITFDDGSAGATNYRLTSWSPAIAKLRESPMGGSGPYTDVVETMTLAVKGATMSAAYLNLDTLNRLIDQAQRWWMGENQTAVLIKYAPKGSTIAATATPFQVAVMGWPEGGATAALVLPDDYGGAVENRTFFILNVQLSFRRRGQWLLSETSASGASTANGSFHTVTMSGALTTPGPTKIVVTGYPSGAATDRGFLLIAGGSTATDEDIVDAEPALGASGAPWTSVNEAANYARWTNVLRYTPTTTAESESGLAVTPAPVDLSTQPRTWAVFVNVRNNSLTTSFLLRARISTPNTGYSTFKTPYVFIAPYVGAVAPAWIYLGAVSVNYRDIFRVSFLATASAAAGTLDIGDCYLANVADPHVYVLNYGPTESAAAAKDLVIDHSALTKPRPYTINTIFQSFSVTGDAFVTTKSTNIRVVNLITKPSTNDWRQVTTVPAVVNNVFTLSRYGAYLFPQ